MAKQFKVIEIDSAGNGMTYDGQTVGSGYDATVWQDAFGGRYGALYDVREKKWGGWVELGEWASETSYPAAFIAARPGDYWTEEDDADLVVVDTEVRNEQGEEVTDLAKLPIGRAQRLIAEALAR